MQRYSFAPDTSLVLMKAHQKCQRQPVEALRILATIDYTKMSKTQSETHFIITANCLFNLKNFQDFLKYCDLNPELVDKNEGLKERRALVLGGTETRICSPIPIRPSCSSSGGLE